MLTRQSAQNRAARKLCIVCGKNPTSGNHKACLKCFRKNVAPVSDDLIIPPKNGVLAIDTMHRPLKPPGRL